MLGMYDAGSADRTAAVWLPVLLGLGVLLSAGLVAAVVLVVAGVVPPYALAFVSIGIWGPICVGGWVVLHRIARRTQRLRSAGIEAYATVTAVRNTASSVGRRPVLRIGLALPGGGSQPVSIRSAPPYHLAGLLRTGRPIPVVFDPTDPRTMMIDWPRAEREAD